MKPRQVNSGWETITVWEMIRLDRRPSIIGWEARYCVSWDRNVCIRLGSERPDPSVKGQPVNVTQDVSEQLSLLFGCFDTWLWMTAIKKPPMRKRGPRFLLRKVYSLNLHHIHGTWNSQLRDKDTNWLRLEKLLRCLAKINASPPCWNSTISLSRHEQIKQFYKDQFKIKITNYIMKTSTLEERQQIKQTLMISIQ